MNQKNLQIIKEALFGAKARAEQRDNAQAQQQMEAQFNQQHQDLVRGGMSSQDAINQMKSTQQSGIDQDAQRRSAFDKEMSDMDAQRNTQGRASSQSGYRSAYQKPEAPRPAPLRGALSSSERENDRIVQQQIAQNVQRGTAPVNARSATPEQAANAAAGKGYHTVDQTGAVRYTEGGQSQAQQPQQDPYLKAQQDATKQYPELGQAGSAMNKKFLELTQSAGGADALRKNPELLSQLARQSSEATTAQAAQPTPAPDPNENPDPGLPGEPGNESPAPSPAPTPTPAPDPNENPDPGLPGEPGNESPAPSPSPTPTPSPSTADNSLLTSPAASNPFSGNVSLNVDGGTSPAAPAPAPAAPAPAPAAPAPAAAAPGQPIQANTGPSPAAPAPANQPPKPGGPSAIARILGGNPFPRSAPAAPSNPSAGPAPIQPQQKAPGDMWKGTAFHGSQTFNSIYGKPKPAGVPAAKPTLGQPLQGNSTTTDSQGRLTPKTGELDDATIEAIQDGLRKQAEAGDAFSEGIIAELNLMSMKMASEKQAEEREYLSHLNTELKKMASEVEGSYSHEDIDSFTRDLASFEKAASEEAAGIWQGMLEELVKEGADEAFVEGMTKEAINFTALKNLGSVASKLNLGELGTLGKGLWQNLGKGSATQRALASHGKQLGGLTNAAGDLVHGADIPHLKGSRSLGVAEHLSQALPDLHSTNPAAADAVKRLRQGAVGQFGEGLGIENKGVLDKSYLGLLNDAEHGVGKVKTKAEKAISKIRGGDYSSLGEKGNFDASRLGKLQGKSTSAIPLAQRNLPEALDTMKGHAGEVVGSGGAANASSYVPHAVPHVATGSRAPQGGSIWKGVKGMTTGGLAGSLIPIPGATAVGALGGLAYGLGPMRSALVGGVGYFGGKKLLNMAGIGGADNAPDASGMQADRHRILPGVSNQTTGAIGGALLSMMMAREMGLSGPAAFLAPVLGGLAGHHFLPHLMNKWKDPYGSGANQMNPFAAGYNRQHPLIGEPEAPQSYSASLPPAQ